MARWKGRQRQLSMPELVIADRRSLADIDDDGLEPYADLLVNQGRILLEMPDLLVHIIDAGHEQEAMVALRAWAARARPLPEIHKELCALLGEE